MTMTLETLRSRYPDKFATEAEIFRNVRRGARIFVGTGCAEPEHLVTALVEYVESHPKAVFDAEVLHVWTLGVAPYTDEKFRSNFRHNSFFIADNSRDAVNAGLADYTPVFLSQVPALFKSGLVPIDVALIQTSPPDSHGYMSLGISVDIVRAAADAASLVIAQMNANMPRVHGDGFIHVEDVDYIIPYDTPILEYHARADDEIARKIGKYVSRLVQDGDTIQVGYGSVPNAIMLNLADKVHLGIHTELLSDGLIDLIRTGAVDNSRKQLDPGKTIAAFCMGTRETYGFIDDNPTIEFRTVDYTNDVRTIAAQDNMVAINSALQIDLTGQATAESLGKTFYSGIGGQADFMRGAVLSRNGKTILALPSTAQGGTVSRIVPFLTEGAGATLNRGDVQYVVTEYGIAYLSGKNIRERAMELIAIAHPDFREDLIAEAKSHNLIYQDQAFIADERAQYPEELETWQTTKTGLELFLRPVRISDEPLLQDFFYALSEDSLYRRFLSKRMDMPHERVQEFVVIDYTTRMVILATLPDEEKEELIGIGEFYVDEDSHTAEVAFAVRDDYQGQGVGTELLKYLTYLAKRRGLLGFTADTLMENRAMLRVFEKMGFDVEKHLEDGVYELTMWFK